MGTYDNIVEAVLVMFVGMGGVFASLTLLAGMIWCFKFADEYSNRKKITNYSKKIESEETPDEVNDELVAVLSAAIEATLHKSVIIRKIQFLGGKSTTAWRSSGRSTHMRSHQINLRK